MSGSTILRRLSASFFQTVGQWEIHAQENGRLVIRRDEIVLPLFSPLWFLGGIFALVIYVNFTAGVENGWRGTPFLVIPILIMLWMAFGGARSNFLPERLDFDKGSKTLKIVESDGRSKTTRVWTYGEIGSLVFVPPPVAMQTSATDKVVLRPIDPELPAVCIESIGRDAARIHAAIDSVLPSRIERLYGRDA